MKKIFSYSLLFCFCILFFTTCKKYPDGPLISFRTKEYRVKGTWDIQTFLINGVDSTSNLPYDPNNPMNYHEYIFGPSGMSSQNFISGGNESGEWNFNSDKSEIIINISATPFNSHSPFLSNGQLSWEIRRLTMKEMWLKIFYSSKEYYIKFKKI